MAAIDSVFKSKDKPLLHQLMEQDDGYDGNFP
jgi:hypothetical protein